MARQLGHTRQLGLLARVDVVLVLLNFELESHARVDQFVDAGTVMPPHQNRHVDVLDATVGVFGHCKNVFNNVLLVTLCELLESDDELETEPN